jgi:hypothetical protein
MREEIESFDKINDFLIEFLENINAKTKERDKLLCLKLEKDYLDITVKRA